MLTVNQARYLACLPLLGRKPHTILSWPPWNHVFAGNSDFNMRLANGGGLYLGDGKPTGELFECTLENLRMHPGTLAIDLPIAHALTVQAMRADPDDDPRGLRFDGRLTEDFKLTAGEPGFARAC